MRNFVPRGTMTGSTFRNNFSSIGLVLSRGVKWLKIPQEPSAPKNTPFKFQDWGLPFTGIVPTTNDIRALATNDAQKLDLSKKILEISPQDHTVLYTAEGNLHFYTTVSKGYTINKPEHVINLRNNSSRLFWSIFPNGSIEMTPEGFATIKDGVAAQLEGKAAGGMDLLQGADLSATRRENWKANAPLEGPVRLGSSSYIIQSDHKITSDANLYVSSTVQTTTDIHIFDGTTVKMIVMDKETGLLHVIVIGAGEHPVTRSLDTINVWMQAPLWTSMAEDFVALINHFGGQAEEGTDAFVDIIVDPKRMRAVLDPISPDTKSRRTFLGIADYGSGIAISVLSSITRLLENAPPPPPPTPEQVSSIEGGLDTLTPDVPLLSDDDLQELSSEEQIDPNPPDGETSTPDETNPDGETGVPDGTRPDGGISTPDETRPDGETGVPDETNPDGEGNVPDGTRPDGETGVPVTHEPGTGHGE